MKISGIELERLIKEELKEALEQYPADAMAEITATIFSLADQAGVETTGDQRQDIVGELEELLKGQGFELHEQGLVFAEPLRLDLYKSPLLLDLIINIIDVLGDAAEDRIVKAFERGGIDVVPDTVPEEEPSDEEDQTDTVVVPPVEPPPVVPPVEPPPEDGPESVDASEFNKFFLTLDDQSMKALIKEVTTILIMPFTGALMGADDATKARFYEFMSPRAQEYLEDDQKIMRGADGTSVGPEDIHRYQQEVLKFARDMGLGEEESFENPWAFKWFWEDGALDDLGDDREDSEVVRNLKSIPTGKEITIGILAGLAGTAGLYALWKYLFGAEDDEDLPPGLAQSVADQAEDLEALTGIDVQDPEFVVSVLKWVLSLTLDEGQMVWVDRLEPIIRVLSQQDITPEALSSLLDEVPGIELIDKLPGGREKVVEVMMDKWDDMSDKERLDLILMLAPEEYLEMLDQVLKTSPRMSDIPGMDFPGVKSGLYVWLEDGPVLPPRGDFDPPLWEFLLLAAARLGLVDGKHVTMAHQIISDLWDSLEESKEDGKVKRGMKLMKMLLQEQQLNRMKVLAGVK